MRNLTRSVAMLLMGVSLPMVSLMAEDPEPGTSFTSNIVNPSYETGTSEGWTITGATGAVNYQIMEVFNSGFDCYQIITGLPEGTYQLTADGFSRPTDNDSGVAYDNGTEKINLFLYAKTSLREKKTPFFSLYSVKGLTAPEEGWAPNLNGFVNNMFAANWAFENDSYKENTVNGIVVGPDGTVTIGVKTEGTTGTNCWSIWDNFNLTYMGPAGLAAYTQTIEEFESSLRVYDIDQVPSGIYDEMQKVLNYSTENSGSTDTGKLQEVIDSLTNVLARVETAVTAMETLSDLTEKANSFQALGWNGKEALLAVLNKTYALMSPDAVTEEGNLVYTEDLKAIEATLESALRTYRFNEPITNPASGVDFTWVMQSPNFTKPGGDQSTSADASSAGWVHENVPATNAQYRLNFINGKNCWNNWNDNFTSMNVYQVLEGMPAGLYTFECYQTNNGPETTDQHAYITALGGTAISPYATYTQATDPEVTDFANAKWEGPLQTEKILVGTDGDIRVGFASTSNKNGTSGWFCFTDCVLTYYGPGDYTNAMQSLIESAELLLEEDMLATTNKALSTAITVAGTVDTSDAETAEAGMNALNEAIATAKEDMNVLSTFKAGSYAKAVEIADNGDGVYSDEISDLMQTVVESQSILLDSDTITSASFPVMTATLDQYISYTDAYAKCDEYQLNLEDGDLITLIAEVLEEQTAAVAQDAKKIDSAKAMFTAIMSFSDTYLLGMSFEVNEEYPASMVAQLIITCGQQFEVVAEDHSKAATAAAEISKVLGEMRFAGLGIEPGADSDVTSLVIVNPDIETGNESTGNSTNVPEGWTISRTNGDKNSTTSQHWSGVSENRYMDSWNATAGSLKFTAEQAINGIPNGTYRLVAAVRSSGNGAYIFAKTGDGFKLTEIKIDYDKAGSIWDEAEEDSEIKLVHDGIGYGWNWMEVGSINVNTNSMTIGISNDPAFTGSGVEWNGNWFSGDDFQLFYTSSDYIPLGLEDIDAGSASELIAYSENGYITVEGAETYTIYTLNGTEISANAQLAPGIYIVKAGEKVAKVAVK